MLNVNNPPFGKWYNDQVQMWGGQPQVGAPGPSTPGSKITETSPFTQGPRGPGNPSIGGPQNPFGSGGGGMPGGTGSMPQMPYTHTPPWIRGGAPVTQRFNASQMPLNGQVNSSIAPQPVYSGRQTNAAANQAEAEGMRASGLAGLLKQLDRPGVSRSAGSVAAVMPQMAQLQQQGQFDAQQIRQNDELANRQSLLSGQQSQDQEGLGLMNILRQIYGIGQQQDMNNLNLGLGMLGSFF